MRIMCGFCDTIYDSGDPEQREMHSHGTAAPERAESTSTDALWREYEEARDAAVRRAFRDGRAGVPDDDESDAMGAARARLDAAVRALAAHRPGPPGVAGDDGAPERAADGHADGEG